jgi:hypothetical protein
LNFDRDEHKINSAKTRRQRKIKNGQMELL